MKHLVALAFTDCGDDPANLVNTNNCDFDSEVLLTPSQNWTNVTGLPLVGDPDVGSGLVELAGLAVEAVNTCVNASGTGPTDMIGFGGRLLVNSGDATNTTCTLHLDQHTLAGCTGSVTTRPKCPTRQFSPVRRARRADHGRFSWLKTLVNEWPNEDTPALE